MSGKENEWKISIRYKEINREIINIAIKTYRNKKVKMADNLIGSTAKLHNLTLVTRNIDDFKNMELDIFDIYE